MSPHTNYEEWRQQGLANIRKLRMRFLQDCTNDDYDDGEDDLTPTRKRKVPSRSVVDQCPPTKSIGISEYQSDTSSDVYRVYNGENEVSDDVSSSLRALVDPLTAVPRKTFGGRKTSTTVRSLPFTVKPGLQFLGLLEGLVPVNYSYTVKDYKRQVLWEGDFDKVPKTVRLAENHSSLATGLWTASMIDNALEQLLVADHAQSISLRHTVRGKHLPKRLSSQVVHNLECWDQQQLFGKALKETDVCIGSLSFIAFEGFDSFSEKQAIQSAALDTWTQQSFMTEGEQKSILRSVRINGETVGVSLLCALSSEGGTYQVQMLVDEKDHQVIGLDVIFDAKHLPASTSNLTPSKLQMENKIDVLQKWRSHLSHQVRGNDSTNDRINNHEVIPNDASTKKSIGELAAELTNHLEALGDEELCGDSTSSPDDCNCLDDSIPGREEASGEKMLCGSSASSADNHNGQANGSFIQNAEYQETTSPKFDDVVRSDPNQVMTAVRSEVIVQQIDVTVPAPALVPSARSAFRTAKKPEKESTSARLPLVTPYCNDGDKDDEEEESELVDIADGRRQLGEEFETMSHRCLNACPSQIDFEVSSKEEHLEDLSHCSFDLGNETESAFIDADGDPLSTTFAVDSYEGTEFQDGKYPDSCTAFYRLHVAMSDVFFGCHDAAGIIEMKGTEVGGSFVDDEESGYETWLGYIWFQWALPMAITAAVAGPAAQYAIQFCHEIELLQEPETMTWTEWFWSWI